MIYIITPYLADYMNVCRDNNFETKRRSRPNFATWISSPIQFMGIRLHKDDKIIYGDKFLDFSTGNINKFELEIAIRLKK